MFLLSSWSKRHQEIYIQIGFILNFTISNVTIFLLFAVTNYYIFFSSCLSKIIKLQNVKCMKYHRKIHFSYSFICRWVLLRFFLHILQRKLVTRFQASEINLSYIRFKATKFIINTAIHQINDTDLFDWTFEW